MYACDGVAPYKCARSRPVKVVNMIGILVLVLVLLVGLVLLAAIIVGVVLAVRAASKPSGAQQYYPGGPALNAQAGWYPAPDNVNLVRYFDGRQWTASTQPR
jgi:hypothetical protein